MPTEPTRAAQPPQQSSDRIALIAARPLPPGAGDLLSSLAPRPDSEETIYLSTPITTGPRLLDALSKNPELAPDASIDAVREEVIRENLRRLTPLRQRIHSKHPEAHVIDPTILDVQGWTQADYHRFWVEVIRTYVDRVVFADGWELSTGCAVEYATALELGLPSFDANSQEIRPARAATALRAASTVLDEASRDGSIARDAAERARLADQTSFKDSKLAELATAYNVASFVSFTPIYPILRHGVLARTPFRRAMGVEASIKELLSSSRSGRVNVRTFRPEASKGSPFHYGMDSLNAVVDILKQSSAAGYYCIINETIDIHDGGVSGVSLGGAVEFSPDDTPRAVERDGTARLPIEMAQHILRNVYGDDVAVPSASNLRIEFSIHPLGAGFRREKLIVWEVEEVSAVELQVDIRWPNNFSRLVGDKTFGLLVANAAGAPVPSVTAINRRVAPFRFGQATGTGEWWMRTAPASQAPGHFTTTYGWTDPFALLSREDPQQMVASVLAQEGVDAKFSGATLPTADGGGHIIEGVAGSGDEFMLGARETSDLPTSVKRMVENLLKQLEQALGAGIRIEWAADRDRAWVLQLHRASQGTDVGVFNPGAADVWLPFDPSEGLESLAGLIARAQKTRGGIEVTRPIGLTSHVGDLLRKAGVPGRLRTAND